MNMEQLYATHTPYTDFSDWDCFQPSYGSNILQDPQGAIELANQLVAHYNNAEFNRLGRERAVDLNLRSATELIQRFRELNSQPDKPTTQVAGRCRDLAVLICSQFRAQNIPARLRFGFTHMYYKTNLALTDHVVVEYFDQGRWKILEPRGTLRLVEHQNLDVNPIDVETNRFIDGARAWRSIRAKKMRAEWFSGVTPNAETGQWYVRKIMLYDLASLCRYEADVFDVWGYLTDSKPGVMPKFKPHLTALDEMAAVDLNDSDAFAELYKMLVEDDRFLPDGEVMITPTLGKRSSTNIRKSEYAVY